MLYDAKGKPRRVLSASKPFLLFPSNVYTISVIIVQVFRGVSCHLQEFPVHRIFEEKIKSPDSTPNSLKLHSLDCVFLGAGLIASCNNFFQSDFLKQSLPGIQSQNFHIFFSDREVIYYFFWERGFQSSGFVYPHIPVRFCHTHKLAYHLTLFFNKR